MGTELKEQNFANRTMGTELRYGNRTMGTELRYGKGIMGTELRYGNRTMGPELRYGNRTMGTCKYCNNIPFQKFCYILTLDHKECGKWDVQTWEKGEQHERKKNNLDWGTIKHGNMVLFELQ